jgi:hypothetical protein
MPRTWGYIVIIAAIVVGAAALLLPVPDTIEVERVEPPKAEPARPPVPVPAPRARVKQPAPPPARTPDAAPKPVPMQDTTKTRQLIAPKPAG